ncbi:MAG: COG3014 family protein [Myxococcota bacterium]
MRGRAAAIFFGLLVGCASQTAIVQQYQDMRPDIVRGDYRAAIEKLKASRGAVYQERDRVAYWLNLGTLQHYAGEYAASMDSLVSAEETMRELWTKSVSEEVARFIVSDAAKTYAGEDFERVLVYFYTALNQVQLGKVQDALVEARRADQELQRMKIAYEKEGGLGTVYVQDAFMLWLIGVFYEIEGSYADAFLAYRAAEEAYQKQYSTRFGTAAPAFLAEDLLRSAVLGNRSDVAAQLRGRADGQTLQLLQQGWAEIIVIHGNGEAPYKVEKTFTAPLPGGQVTRLAFPSFVPVPHRVARAEVAVGPRTGATQTLEPVDRIASAQFEAQLPGIKARTIARAAIKYAAVAGLKRAVGGGRDASDERRLAGTLVGLFGSIAGAAVEAADLRAWTTLPAEFGATRLWVPPGSHRVDVQYVGRNGGVVSSAAPITVRVRPGERRILNYRSLQ